METRDDKLIISKEKAIEIYDESPVVLRKMLEDTFGIFCFRSSNFEDFKTFDDLCRCVGIKEVDFDNKWKHLELDPSTLAFERLKVLTRAYNQDWIPNVYDTGQKRWFPIFSVLSSGIVFSYSYYYYDITFTYVGSRLCFKSEETSTHAGKTFSQLFIDLITAKH